MLESNVDFLEWTVPADRVFDVLEMLPGGFQVLDGGWRGYTSSALVAGGKGRVGWHEERPEMGVHCSLGSQALGVLAGLDDRWADVPGVLSTIRDHLGGKVTRLDVAWDDREGLLDLETIAQTAKSGAVSSRWRKAHRWDPLWGDDESQTLYFGRSSSDAMLRIYDKVAERAAKGEPVKERHWIRVELQLRRKRADAAAELFQQVKASPGRVFRHLAGILKGYVDFKEPNPNDSNKRRWATVAWWDRFLGYVEKARLVVEKVRRTLQDVKDWLERQVAPSLALIEKGMGEDAGWAFLFGLADQGRARWGPRHRAILAASGG